MKDNFRRNTIILLVISLAVVLIPAALMEFPLGAPAGRSGLPLPRDILRRAQGLRRGDC